MSTGTQEKQRGEHHLPLRELYHRSILSTWTLLGLPRLQPFFLSPSPEFSPDSSLIHMFGVLADQLPASPVSPWLIDSEGGFA